MEIREATFVKSSDDYRHCPPPDMPEYAFIGRSNVGKSSLINKLTNRKNLAKTSQKPGKTQLINHFLINENWYLVDLPGYGWAQTSKTNRERWEKMIREYILERENLHCMMVLLDSRLEAQNNDLEFMRSLGEAQVPFVMVYTKADKQKNSKTEKNIAAYQRVMLKEWEELPPHFVTSANTGEGVEALLQFIAEVNEESALYKK